MSESNWRLLIDPPAAGAWNMAVDEALLESCARGDGPPTLRLYEWQPAALSLGAHQPPIHDPEFLREQGIHLVRRPTGGLAVLHQEECTYSVCGELRSGSFSGSVLDTYLRIAEALVGALALLGVSAEVSGHHPVADTAPMGDMAACFGRTSSHEIRVDGRKLIGSAQVRRRGAFLQHGAIPLVSDPERLARALGSGVGEASTDLHHALGHPADKRAVTEALVRAFQRRFGARIVPGSLSDDEHVAATLLYSWKYLSGEWTLGRQPAIHD